MLCERAELGAKLWEAIDSLPASLRELVVLNRLEGQTLEQIAAGGAIDWAALALDLGYFDQAHFIRDFRALVGVSPGAYVRGMR